MRKFLDRVYALRSKISDTPQTEAVVKALARATDKIGADLERFKTNTAVSALMVLMNALEKEDSISRETFRTTLTLFAPFAPHLAEHLYEEVIGKEGSVHQEPWPIFNKTLLEEEEVTIGVQIGGKKRGEITISPAASEQEALAAALLLPKVREALPNGMPSRVIYLAGKILNLVP
jgi:leucyl-tRNA synthetase